MRVCLPTHPRSKTLSKPATIDFVREYTNILLPKAIKYDCNFNNDLVFEWIIQDLVPGKTLEETWHQTRWLHKELLVRKVITYLSALFKRRFERMGSLYTTNGLMRVPLYEPVDNIRVRNSRYHLGEIVSYPFFSGNRLTYNISRGPFKSSREWLVARLQFIINDSDNPPKNADEDDLDTAQCVKVLALRLLAIMPKVFPETDPENDTVFVLHNHDLHMGNILLNSDGNLSGIVDWECIYTSPLWLACQLPKFLQGRTRHEVPTAEDYSQTKDYEERLQDYETTRLRQFFFEEMERVQPEWVKIFKHSEMKVDFEKAVEGCAAEYSYVRIDRRLKGIEKGREVRSLKEEIRDPTPLVLDGAMNT